MKILPLPNGVWRLTESIEFHIPDFGIIIWIPTGYETDGYSIPRLLWPIAGHPFEPPHEPAWVHDWLCDRATTYAARVFADAVFLVAQRQYGVPWWKRWARYLAVRWYGRYVWLLRHLWYD